MKKYSPSFKNNNVLKQKTINELKMLIFKLENGKFNASLNAETVVAVLEGLKEQCAALNDCIGTGEENIGVLIDEVATQIKALNGASAESAAHRFDEAATELGYTLGLLIDVLNGSIVPITESDMQKARVNSRRKRLLARLAELERIKTAFAENGRRLEREISGLEKDLAEYEEALLKEENERRINDLFRQIKSAKSKIDMLNIRHGNYSACYNLLDIVYADAREILCAPDFIGDGISVAKILLDIEKLKRMIADPDRAIVVLRRIGADIKSIEKRTASIDDKIFGSDRNTSTVNAEALAYKNELERQRSE